MIGVPLTTLAPNQTPVNELESQIADFVRGVDSPEMMKISRQALASAVRRLNSRTWSWTRTFHDVTLTPGDWKYQLPHDYKATVSHRPGFAFTRSVDTTRIDQHQHYRYVTPQQFDRRDYSFWYPQVRYDFTVRNSVSELLMEFPVGMADQLAQRWDFFRHNYYRRLMLPVHGVQFYQVPNEVEDFMIWHARAELAAKFAPDQVAQANSRATQSWGFVRSDDRSQHNR